MILSPNEAANSENNEYFQKIYAKLHRRHPDGIRLEFWTATRSRLVWETVQTAIDVTLSLKWLYDLEYGIDLFFRIDMLQRIGENNTDMIDIEDNPT